MTSENERTNKINAFVFGVAFNVHLKFIIMNLNWDLAYECGFFPPNPVLFNCLNVSIK